MIERSFVLPAAFPSSKNGAEALEQALQALRPFGFSMIEYYCENLSPAQARRLLTGKRSVFLAGTLEKTLGLNPCASDASVRREAVEGLTEGLHFAREAGAEAIMISSGRRPDSEAEDAECLACFRESVLALHRAEPEMGLLIEPGDREVEYRHLIGPTRMAVDFAAGLREMGVPVGLTFDISHTAQLGETIGVSWELAKPYCSHVHFANCVLRKGSPLYGDKHPLFGAEDGEYSSEDGLRFFASLEKEKRPLVASLEMICPAGRSEEEFLEALRQNVPWFFEN